MYPKLFGNAFGSDSITGEYLLKSLSQFQLTLVSSQSRYDFFMAGQEEFTEQEKNGYELFQAHCNSCHAEPQFSSYDIVSNGLPVDTTLNDFGRWNITHQSDDSLKFKIPSLRNLSFSYPYMHDGRFRTIREAIDHYTDGIIEHDNLSDKINRDLKLTSNEKTDLVAFLFTLNDEAFVQNKALHYPYELFKSTKSQ